MPTGFGFPSLLVWSCQPRGSFEGNCGGVEVGPTRSVTMSRRRTFPLPWIWEAVALAWTEWCCSRAQHRRKGWGSCLRPGGAQRRRVNRGSQGAAGCRRDSMEGEHAQLWPGYSGHSGWGARHVGKACFGGTPTEGAMSAVAWMMPSESRRNAQLSSTQTAECWANKSFVLSQ